MENLWPSSFSIEDLTSPSSIINEQANYLGDKTNNIVLAEADLLTDSGDKFRVAFSLIARSLNNYKYRLFTIEHPIRFYPLTIFISGELGQDLESTGIEVVVKADKFSFDFPAVVCEDEETFLSVLKAILYSNHTKIIVESLIAQSKAFVRPTPAGDDIPF